MKDLTACSLLRFLGLRTVEPTVFFCAQKTTCFDSHDNSGAIANDDVKKDMIPPAFLKVFEEVFKRDFKKLKHDTQDPTQNGIAKHDGFQPPAEKVGRHELVIDGVH